jgi:hypothetical protein
MVKDQLRRAAPPSAVAIKFATYIWSTACAPEKILTCACGSTSAGARRRTERKGKAGEEDRRTSRRRVLHTSERLARWTYIRLSLEELDVGYDEPQTPVGLERERGLHDSNGPRLAGCRRGMSSR